LLAASWASACDDATTVGQCTPRAANTELGEASAWTTAAEAGLDPFPGHRPEAIQCSPSAAYVEDAAFEVDMGLCNYMLAAQVLTEPLRACEELTATVAHFRLLADEPAEAHVALALGHEVIWERSIPIPTFDAGVYTLAFSPDEDIPAGTPLVLHLHNHGANTWYLTNIRVGPAP